MEIRFTWTAISALLAAALASGCGGTTITELTGPGGVRCQTSLESSLPTVPAGGGNLTVMVVAARECTWSAGSEASWARVSPASGQGQGELSITVSENSQPTARTATLLLNEERFTLSQAAAPAPPSPAPPPPGSCVSSLSPSAASFSSSGGQGTIQVAASPLCVWTASASAGWISITSSSTNFGSRQVRYEVAELRGRGPRTATITIAGHTHTVTQTGRRDDDDDDDD